MLNVVLSTLSMLQEQIKKIIFNSEMVCNGHVIVLTGMWKTFEMIVVQQSVIAPSSMRSLSVLYLKIYLESRFKGESLLEKVINRLNMMPLLGPCSGYVHVWWLLKV